MNPLFSIITISYNSDKTIERTINSVLSQTLSDYEYIIVDGASTDKTVGIIQSYEPKFEGKLKWISEPDKGIYNAMNKGLRLAKGQIVGIVNSDDWLEQNALQLMKDRYEREINPNDCIYCGWIRFHYKDGTSQLLKTDHKVFESWAKRYDVAGVRHPAVFVPLEVYSKHGLFDEQMKVMADSDLLLRFYFEGVKFCYPEAVVSNMSDGGVSNRLWEQIYRDYKLILDKYHLSAFRRNTLLILMKAKSVLKKITPNKLFFLYRKISKA